MKAWSEFNTEFSVSRPWRQHQAWLPLQTPCISLHPAQSQAQSPMSPPRNISPAPAIPQQGWSPASLSPVLPSWARLSCRCTFQPHLHTSPGMCQVPKGGTAPLPHSCPAAGKGWTLADGSWDRPWWMSPAEVRLIPVVQKLQHQVANGPHGALTLVMYLGHYSESTKEITASFEPKEALYYLGFST